MGIITGFLSLTVGGFHIKAHWAWYRNFIKSGIGKKSKVTIVLSVLFLILEGGNSSIGMWHYRLGLVMIVFILIHITTRFSLMMKGLGWKKKDIS